MSVTTNAAGRAVAAGFAPTAPGAVEISIQALFQGQAAVATITETTFATAAEAAAAAASATGSGAATTGTAATGAGGSAGGASATAIGAIGGGIAGGAALAAAALRDDPTPLNTNVSPLVTGIPTITVFTFTA